MKRTILTLIVAIATMVASSAPVTVSQAEAVARQFSSRSSMRQAPGRAALTLAHEAKAASGLTDYYVFNRDGGGYIVVSGDDRALPVLGYSDGGTFDADEMPDNMRWWLSEYQREMEWLRQNLQAAPRQATTLTTSVSPLLSTQWAQGRPFNNYCPASTYPRSDYNTYYGGRAVTGCVATAMAQVMKYHNWPPTGVGSHSYTCSVQGGTTQTLSANFGQTTYDWANMANVYRAYIDTEDIYVGTSGWTKATQAQQNAVARLMSDVGISVDMEYGNSSGTTANVVVPAYTNYFRYDAQARLASRDYYNGQWDETLRAELDASRPIWYCGSGYGGGHAFVFDGYNTDGYFHVNWGWNGSYDGYFSSSALNPDGLGTGGGTGAYNYNQSAVLNLAPAKLVLNSNIAPTSSTMPMNNVTATATVKANGAAYSGKVRAYILNADGYWISYADVNVNATANQTKTVNFTMSFNGTAGNTYFLRLANPNLPDNWWSDGVAFTASAGSGTVLATGIQLNKTTTTLTVGNTETLQATVTPSNATNKAVSWNSSNTSVATVSNGVVTAKAAGTATITATTVDGSNLSATCRVTVQNIPVTSVTIAPSSVTLMVSATEQLDLSIAPSNATNKDVTWTSSNQNVAIVSMNGLVTAKAAGTATITATAKDGSGKKGTCAVTVISGGTGNQPKMTAPELTLTNGSIGHVNELPLTLTMPAGDNFKLIQIELTYPDGLIPIADTDNNYGETGASIPLRGGQPVMEFAHNFDCDDFWPYYRIIGTGKMVNYTFTPVSTNPCQLYTVYVAPSSNFTSGDRDVLVYVKYIDSNDQEHTIGSDAQPVKLTTIHFENTSVVPVSSVAVSPTTALLKVGTSTTLTATVSPSNATNKAVSWSSSNSSVVTVDQNGKVTAKVAGTATITATAQDGSGKKGTCVVTVTSPSTAVPRVTAPDITIGQSQIGQPIAVPLTLTMPAGGNMTLIQVRFTFPDGLRPALVSVEGNNYYLDETSGNGFFTEVGDDIVTTGRPPQPVLFYTDNVWNEDNNCFNSSYWPNYTIVGSGFTQTPNTANPMHFVTIFVTPMAGFASGTRPLKAYVKYIQKDNQSLTFGEEDSPETICYVNFIDAVMPNCDVNRDGRVDTDDVNAVINLILQRTTQYADTADVNGDGQVSVFDMNLIIDYILAQ